MIIKMTVNPDDGTDPEPDPEPEPTNEPKSVSQAERLIDELRAEISDLRKSHSSDRKKSDEVIGGLTSQIEELKGYIENVNKQFEKVRARPKQTLVPPPAPPVPDDATKPVPPGEEAKPKKSGLFGRIW